MKRTIVAALSVGLMMVQAGRARAEAADWMGAPDPGAAPVAKWIWSPNQATNGETENFRVVFDPKMPEKVMTENPSSALLWVAGDDDVTVAVNGKVVGKAARGEGSGAFVADVRAELIPGNNVISVVCKNLAGPAGIVVKLAVRGQYREPFFLVSDDTWTCAADAPRGWRQKNFSDAKWAKARVLGAYGMEPWGKVDAGTPITGATTVDHLTLLPGFKAELVYSVPKTQQGSWVSMTPDPKGRLYVSDQGGSLYRVTPGTGQADTKVEPLPLIGSAQGLLWANNGLFVMINGKYKDLEAGMYRLTDTDGDDKLDKVEKLLALKGRYGDNAGGEHGPHAIVMGPDHKLYFPAGNFTGLPAAIEKTSPAAHWAEDLLLIRQTDGKGHDPNIFAPGGWVCRMDPDGKHVEAFLTGLRNTYDIAFDPNGELFGYDSDMEWDMGAPWYRPTRVCHFVSGAEFGWRNGSGKWPTYYPDSLPPVVNTGAGSPTGVTFGTGAKFPAKYQHAFFANDWAYGKVYAVHMKPEGASFSATYEPFILGKPFDVTDVVINPTDGAMYVTIGGRSTQSGLYRITYVGDESTKPAKFPNDKKPAKARELRHKLEAFHGHQDPAAVKFAWEYLDSSDRFIRYAARVAVEAQPASEWQDKALAEKRPTAAINALLALDRVGDKTLEPRVMAALDRLDFATLKRDQQLELLRTYDVCFIRMGQPDAATMARYVTKFDAMFPSRDKDLDHELSQLLVYCQSPTIVAKAMNLVAVSDTQEEQFFYAFIVRHMKIGWTPATREQWFKWITMAEEKYTGGASYQLFLQHTHDEAVATLSDDEKKSLAAVITPPVKKAVASNVKPHAYVRSWQMEDLVPKLGAVDHGRSFENGKAAFEAVSCVKCHRFNGDGGGVGPDISGVGQRFNANDLLESIIKPSKVISDQYAETKFVTKSSGVFVGTVQSEDADHIVIRSNPLAPTTDTIDKKDLVRRSLSNVSPMPEGLLNVLSEDEILDMLAYIRSGGKMDEKVFRKM